MENLKLIMLKDPILISSQLDVRDTFPYLVAEKLRSGEWTIWQVDNHNDLNPTNQRKIIAGLPGLPSLDLSKVMEELELIDLEDLIPNRIKGRDMHAANLRAGFRHGFKAHRDLSAKKYSLEDIKAAFGVRETVNWIQLHESLLHPRVYDVKVETMEEDKSSIKVIEIIKK